MSGQAHRAGIALDWCPNIHDISFIKDLNVESLIFTPQNFSPEQIRHLLDLAREIKAKPARFSESLKGKALAMIFEKPSLRTRVTFDVGGQQLGGFSIYLSPAEISLGKRESIHDVAKNLERMVQGIMIRTFAHDIVERMAEWARVPVINGLTDFSHPCQAMADFLTILEHKGRLGGLKLAYVGDSNNVSNSLMFAAARFGMPVRFMFTGAHGDVVGLDFQRFPVIIDRQLELIVVVVEVAQFHESLHVIRLGAERRFERRLGCEEYGRIHGRCLRRRRTGRTRDRKRSGSAACLFY